MRTKFHRNECYSRRMNELIWIYIDNDLFGSEQYWDSKEQVKRLKKRWRTSIRNHTMCNCRWFSWSQRPNIPSGFHCCWELENEMVDKHTQNFQLENLFLVDFMDYITPSKSSIFAFVLSLCYHQCTPI